MKLRNFLLGAIAMVVAFSACDQNTEDVISGNPSIELVGLEGDVMTFDADGGERQVSLVANRDWTIEEDADWIQVTPTSGEAADEEQTITIKVVKNEKDEDDPFAGFDREADIKFTVGAKSVYLTIKQEGPQGSTEALIVYYNDFDKEKAQKGENGWATYLDSFEGWNNATGTGVETVTYAYDRITARTNSGNGSAGSYSVYEGSGMNYLWFGSGKPYFFVKDITLPEGKFDFTISFGTERYEYSESGDVDNTFNWDEFKAYASIDGVKWTELSWEFAAGELPDGKWDLASTTIKVPEGTEKLSLYFAASFASAYALDDLKVEESLTAGVAVDFSAGVELNPDEPEQGGESDATAIYSNNFDKEAAQKSSNGWKTYLDSFEGWRNEAGTGLDNVSYAFDSMSARTNSSDGSGGKYSVYEGSGMNYLWFGSGMPYFAVKNITLPAEKTNFTLSFGSERYLYEASDNTFNWDEFKVYISADSKKWVKLTCEFAGGAAPNGKWDLASSTFTIPAGTESLSVYFVSSLGSAYALDDLKLVESATAGTAIDFSAGEEFEIGDNISGGGSVTPPSGDITDVTVEQFNAMPVSTTALYRLTGTVGGPINTQYGNFDLIDATGKVYVYGISNWSSYSSQVVEGVTVTVVGQRGEYNGKIEVLEGYIESCGGESGETPAPTPDGDVVYGNDFDKQISTKSYGSNGSSWPYLDQFDGWMNEVGTGVANVSYTYKSASARATSSNNNIWLPKTGAYLSIQDIALGGETSFKLAFNTICGSPGNYKKTFSSSVFKVYVSADKATWVELPVNVTANGTDFDSAVTTFSVPAGTESLSITFEKLADETDGYRVDAVKLTLSETADNAIDFSQGTAMDFSAGGSGSGNTGGETPTPPSTGEITDVTVEQFNAMPVSTTALYRLTGTVGGPINTQYGNFDLIDATGKVYVYGISNWSDYSATFVEGGTVTVVGQRGDYNGKIEVLEGYIESYTSPAGGSGDNGETPEEPETPADVKVVTVAEFLAATDETAEYQVSGTITGIYQAYNSQYNNISFYLSDGTGDMLVYRMSCEGIADPNTISAADEITVRGTRTLYNDSPQMAQGGICVKYKDITVEVPDGAIVLTFPADSQDKVGSYTSDWTATIGSNSWQIVNFNNNNNGWTYIKCGHKTTSNVSTITTKNSLSAKISEVVVRVDKVIDASKCAAKLEVATDSAFANVVETVNVTLASGSVSYAITAPQAGCYYRLVFDNTALGGSTNGNIQISEVKYISE